MALLLTRCRPDRT